MRNRAVVLLGMHGLGDNLHERAIVSELMRTNDVWLKTPWPQVYWDMPGLHLLPLKSPICWMSKNESRNAQLFGSRSPPRGAPEIRCSYPFEEVKRTGSVLGAMAKICGVEVGDFRMPIAPEWRVKAEAVLAKLAPTKPVLIYRPPVNVLDPNNKSSQAKIARNPDLKASHQLLSGIRDRYFVISLADLMNGHECLVGPAFKADAEFHNGELEFETIAALTEMAALVFCSPGFLCVLSQAVSTPMICVFGGYEGKESFSPGARFSPWLPIEPIHPCACWSYNCRHDKTIDIKAAAERIETFIAQCIH